MGSAALGAAPSLVRVMQENIDVRVPAALALRRVGAAPEVVLPPLEMILRGDEDPYSRLRAIEALRLLGDYSAPAAPFLVRLLGDPDQRIRFEADHTLYRLGVAAVPSLVAGLTDPSASVREACAQNLGEIGVPPGEAVEILTRLVSDPDEIVRQAAAGALAKIPGR
jgi:HEAT repeat protein